MIKQINRVLKLVGLNLVRAKRRKVKWTGRLTVSTSGPEIGSPLLPKSSDGKGKLSDYMGETEWQNTPPRPAYTAKELMECPLDAKCNQPHPIDNGITHYVGDDCPGGHRDPFEAKPENNFCVGYKAKAFVVNPDAAFVPVDIDERPRHCEVDDGAPAPNWETAGGTTPEQNEARFNEPK